MRLNWGAGDFYAEGWWNLEVNSVFHCDQIVDGKRPFATFDDGSIETIYAGHVLEHIVWDEVPGHLAEARRVLVPGGVFMVVGPDLFRAMDMWRDGTERLELVRAVMEDDLNYQAASWDWDGATHRWNCYEDRVVRLLERNGFEDVIPLAVDHGVLAGYPLTADVKWQCAVSGRNP